MTTLKINNQTKLEILQNVENFLNPTFAEKKKDNNYFFLFLSQESLEKDQPVEEILRERTFEYLSNQKLIDFWVIPFFQFEKFHSSFNKNQQFFCIITTNQQFFHFLRLRTGFFERIDFNFQRQTFVRKNERKEEQNQQFSSSNSQLDGFYFSCDSSFSFFYSLIQSNNQQAYFQQSLKKYLPIYQFLFDTKKNK